MPDRDVPANDACNVRLADPEDAHLLQVVLDGSAGTAYANVFGFDAGQLLAVHQVRIAFLDERPIGCVMTTSTDATTIIHGLHVAVPHRGRGHASTLIRAAMDQDGSATSPRTYWTAVDPGVPGALARFTKLGFAASDENFYDLTLMIRPSEAEARSASSPALARETRSAA